MGAVKRTVDERFWSKLEEQGDCWMWVGSIKGGRGGGYGTFMYPDGRIGGAHRWAYERLRAEIPPGLVLDHLCRNRACVNPWHLEPVTVHVNNLRGESPGARATRSNRCGRGHEYTPENTRITTNGSRGCRACMRQWELANRIGKGRTRRRGVTP